MLTISLMRNNVNTKTKEINFYLVILIFKKKIGKSPLSRAFKKCLLLVLFFSILLVIVDLEGNKEFILVD